MYTCPQQALPRVVLHRTQVVKKKWKLRVRFSLTEENRVHQNNFSMKTDKGSFSHAVIRSRLEQKNPVTKYQVRCVCVLFSVAKSMLIMGSCVRFYGPNIFLRTKCSEGSLGQCSRVSYLSMSPFSTIDAGVSSQFSASQPICNMIVLAAR